MSLTILLVSVLMMLGQRTGPEHHGTSFPGVEQLPAPMGRFVVRYFAPTAKVEGQHEVRVVDRTTGMSCWSFKFMRSIDVLSSPVGTAFAVTDWTGSNTSDLTVIVPAESCRVISLPEELLHSLGEAAIPKDTNHVYFEAQSWRTEKVLRFHVWGDTGSSVRKDFNLEFEYELGAKVRSTR